jgi:hypothetical protein
MDLIYGIALIALLAVAWVVVRHVANKARRQRELLRRQKHRSRAAKGSKGPDTVSQRSAMRSTDAPVAVVDTIQKRRPPPPESTGPKNPRTGR